MTSNSKSNNKNVSSFGNNFSIEKLNEITVLNYQHSKTASSGELPNDIYMIIPPDGGAHAWIIVLASFCCNFLIDGIMMSFGGILPILSTSLNISRTTAAYVGSLQLGMYYLSGPVVSAIVNKYGFRLVAFSGAILALISITSSAFMHKAGYICIFYGFFGGLGFGMIYAPSIIIIGYYFERYRAIATSLAVCGSSLGPIFLSPIFMYVIQAYGWHQLFILQGLLFTICAVGALNFRTLDPVKISVSTAIEHQKSTFIKKQTSNLSINSSEFELPNLFFSNPVVALKDTDLKNSESSFEIGSIAFDSMNSRKAFSTIKNSRTHSPFTTNLCYCIPIEWADKFKLNIFYPIKRFCLCRKNDDKFESISFAREEARSQIPIGPLYRKDIFYSGSVYDIPDYSFLKNASEATSFDDRLSQLHIPASEDERLREGAGERVRFIHVVQDFAKAITNILKLLFDVKLLKDLRFVLSCISCFLFMFGILTPYVYLIERSLNFKMPQTTTMWFVSLISIGNTCGRITTGFILSYFPNTNLGVLSGSTTFAASMLTFINTFFLQDNHLFQFAYCVTFGFSISFATVLRPLVYVQIYGIEKLTNAFGLSTMALGMGSLISTPISAIIVENTHNYIYVFLLSGISLLLSSLVNVVVICIELNYFKKINVRHPIV